MRGAVYAVLGRLVATGSLARTGRGQPGDPYRYALAPAWIPAPPPPEPLRPLPPLAPAPVRAWADVPAAVSPAEPQRRTDWPDVLWRQLWSRFAGRQAPPLEWARVLDELGPARVAEIREQAGRQWWATTRRCPWCGGGPTERYVPEREHPEPR